MTKQEWRLQMRKSIDALTKSMPAILKFKRDLAVALATVRRLLGENDALRQTNRDLRKMIIDLQMEKVATDARPK